MRFTIRDLLWMTVVVALGVGWWIEHRQRQASQQQVIEWRQRMQDFIDMTADAVPGFKAKVPLPDGTFMEPTKLPPKGGPPNPSAPAPNPPKN